MWSLSRKEANPQPSKVDFRARPAPEALDVCNLRIRASNQSVSGYALVASGADARRLYGDLAELRALRLKRAGGHVFKRGPSPYWQIRYRDGDGKWRDESSHTESKRDALALLSEKVYQASAGLLPGTVTFEGIIEHFLRDARVRGLRSVPRLERACRALLKRLEGYRAEQIDRALWLKSR